MFRIDGGPGLLVDTHIEHSHWTTTVFLPVYQAQGSSQNNQHVRYFLANAGLLGINHDILFITTLELVRTISSLIAMYRPTAD